MHKQQGWPQAWEYGQAKPIQTLGRASQGVNWSWSQCIKSIHAQTSSGKGLPSHFWNRNIVRSILPGLRRKQNWTVAQWSKVLFSDESKFCISFGNQGPRVWRKSEEAQNPCCLKSSVKFTQSVILPCHLLVLVHCFFWSPQSTPPSTRNIWEHCMLPSADKLHGDADFIFQQDLAPAHTAKGTKSWLNDHGCAWLASKLAWPEPHRVSMGYCQEEDEIHQTQQCRWPEGRYQATWASITPEQCHGLITSMPRRIDAIHAKVGPTK